MNGEQQLLFAEPAPESTPEIAADKFDWWENDAGDVVVETQSSIAIYRNKRGHVVIRGERQVEGDDDMFIAIATEQALRAVIARLQQELKAGL